MEYTLGSVLAFAVLPAYLIGSIPFAVIAGRIAKGIDIRNAGSGNAGATNAYRVLGWKIALVVLVADFSKGFVTVWGSGALFAPGNPESLTVTRIFVLAAVVAGHAFPVWAGFRGGKGVAASAGGIVALYPLAAPFPLAAFIIVLAATRYVSLSSLAAAWILIPGYFIAVRIQGRPYSPWILGFFLLISVGVTVLHRANILRLIRGEEPKIASSGS